MDNKDESCVHIVGLIARPVISYHATSQYSTTTSCCYTSVRPSVCLSQTEHRTKFQVVRNIWSWHVYM